MLYERVRFETASCPQIPTISIFFFFATAIFNIVKAILNLVIKTSDSPQAAANLWV